VDNYLVMEQVGWLTKPGVAIRIGGNKLMEVN